MSSDEKLDKKRSKRRKRKHSVSNDIASKRLCTDVNINNDNLYFLTDLQGISGVNNVSSKKKRHSKNGKISKRLQTHSNNHNSESIASNIFHIDANIDNSKLPKDVSYVEDRISRQKEHSKKDKVSKALHIVVNNANSDPTTDLQDASNVKGGSFRKRKHSVRNKVLKRLHCDVTNDHFEVPVNLQNEKKVPDETDESSRKKRLHKKDKLSKYIDVNIDNSELCIEKDVSDVQDRSLRQERHSKMDKVLQGMQLHVDNDNSEVPTDFQNERDVSDIKDRNSGQKGWSKKNKVSKKLPIDVNKDNSEVPTDLQDVSDVKDTSSRKKRNSKKDKVTKRLYTDVNNDNSEVPIDSKDTKEVPDEKDKSSRKKRKCSVKDKVAKKVHIDVNSDDATCALYRNQKHSTTEEHAIPEEYQYRNIPHHLISLMYRIDLSLLCTLRKGVHEPKYPTMSLAFGDAETDKFNMIVLRYRKKKSVHVYIKNEDRYYQDISYDTLFPSGRQSFSLINYFNSFVRHQLLESGKKLKNVKYLVIYTNAELDLTDENTLKNGRSRNFYPLRFSDLNLNECDLLKDFLFTNEDVKGRGFYQFSRDDETREELLKRLEFVPTVQKIMKNRTFSEGFEREVKEAFLDKLVFAAKQPNRAELSSIVKTEIGHNSELQRGYIALHDCKYCMIYPLRNWQIM